MNYLAPAEDVLLLLPEAEVVAAAGVRIHLPQGPAAPWPRLLPLPQRTS